MSRKTLIFIPFAYCYAGRAADDIIGFVHRLVKTHSKCNQVVLIGNIISVSYFTYSNIDCI